MSDSDSSKPEAPKIEFPCPDYPIKVMGTAGEELKQHVIAVFERHSSTFDANAVYVRPSRNGRYESIGVSITAESKEQLQIIFEDLKKNTLVKMVL